MTDWGFGDWHQLWVQFVATAVSVVHNVSITYIIFKIVDMSVGVHVDKRVIAVRQTIIHPYIVLLFSVL